MENKENNIPSDSEMEGSTALSTACSLFTNQSGLHAKKAFDTIRSSGGFGMQGQQLIDLNLGGEEK